MGIIERIERLLRGDDRDETIGLMPLAEARLHAPRAKGVYCLFLDGQPMKIGKVEHLRERPDGRRDRGFPWRFGQYWRGDRSTAGPDREVIVAAWDRIMVLFVPLAEGARERELRWIDD